MIFTTRVLKIVVFVSTLFLLFLVGTVTASKKPVLAAVGDPAALYVIVQNSGGTRITNATVTLNIGPVVAPQWCNYEGKNGTWNGILTSFAGNWEYWFRSGNNAANPVLQICCNASSFTLNVSAPGYVSQSLAPPMAGVNGSYLDYVVTLQPSTGAVQGLKVLMPGNQGAPTAVSGQTVYIDGVSGTTAYPWGTGYGWGPITAGNHTISVTVPAGYSVGSTACTNSNSCHTDTSPITSNGAYAAGGSRVVNVPAGGWIDLWWHFFRAPTCSPASQSVATGANASLTASFGYNGYSWSAPGGTPSSGSGSGFNVSYATTGAKTVTVTSWGMSANCTVNVSSAPQVEYRIFFDSDADGFLDSGEAFTAGFPFSSSVASLERNGSGGVVSTTASTSNVGVYGPVQVNVGSTTNQFHVIPAAGWQLTNYSSNRNLTGATNCNANVTCSYNSGWTRSWTAVSGETLTVFLGVRRPPTCSPASQTVVTGVNASLTASAGNNSYSWSAPGGTPLSGTGSSFLVSYATTGTKTVTVTSGGLSANCTVIVNASDLVIRNTTAGISPAINGPTTVTCNVNSTYQAETRNIGAANAGASTTRASTTGSTNNSDDIAVAALNVNTSSTDHSFTTSWSSAGTYTVTFTADILGVIGESNEGNNVASITVTVSCPPDLVIRNSVDGTSPAIDGPTSVICQQSYTYQARTRNLGPGSAGASTSRASTTGSTNNSDDIAVAALAVNISSPVYSYTTSWNAAGTYTVTFTADIFSTVAEANEGNNTASITVTVSCQPDLVIRNAADGTSPAITGPTSVTCQQNNTYTARTRNLGPGPAAASVTTASTTGSTNNSDGFTVGALAANTVTSLPAHSFTTSWNSSGTYTVTFSADILSAIAEANEGNNTASITVTVICLPNLRITSIAPIPPTGNVVNEPMSVQAWVDNNGSASAGSFNNRLRARPGNNSFTAADTVNPDFVLPSLGNGSSSPVTWSLTPSVSGLYYFEVCADSNLVITELDETDNCSQTSTTILASRAWLRTVGGNVGSATDQGVGTDSISVWAPNGCPSTQTSCNSEYMIVATRSVKSTFKSAKTWLLTNYTPNLGTYNRYQRFKDDFSAGACSLSGNQFPSTQGRFTYPVGDMIYTSGTTPTACTQFSSLKNAAIIFYEQNLDIQTDLILARPTVFIVKGNVTIRANVGRVDGMFVVDGNFTTESSDQQLRINGSVAAALNTSGLLTFGRDLEDDDNDDTPAELITFDPKYLYILTDFLGHPDSTYEETTP